MCRGKTRQMADIRAVRAFWDSNPLWTGESAYAVGSKPFFEEHRRVYVDDCFAGQFDPRFLPPARKANEDPAILDLGCGIGFWTSEFAMRGFRSVLASDITPRAL